MAPVYSTRFAAGEQTGGSWPKVLYTVPAGRVAVIRDLIVTAYSATAKGSITPNALSEALRLEATANPTFWHLELRAVLNAGEELRLYGDSARWAWWISGYLLTS